MIFVDTSAWFALFTPTDRDHAAATCWLKDQHYTPLVTTDFIVDELLTLLRVRGNSQHGQVLATAFAKSELAELEWVSEADFQNAIELYCSHSDKKWSFTDCTSNVVMQRLKITRAFAFDDHFRQFGGVEVFPPI